MQRDTAPRALALAAAVLAGTVAGPVASAPAHDRVERAVVDALSHERAQRGLPRLRAHQPLHRVADAHSRTMARRGTLDHGAFSQRIRRVAPGRRAGETLARMTGPRLATRVVQAWLHSPPHRAIVLDPGMRKVGVGREGGRGGWYVTADFVAR